MKKIYGEENIKLPEKLEIPKIDDKRLEQLYKYLKPIVKMNYIRFYLKEYILNELKNYPYLINAWEDKREMVDPNKIEMVEDFLCLHKCGEYGLFRPTIAEVLSQMPVTSIREANTFEIIEEPELCSDVFRYPELINNGLNLSRVRTYKVHE